LGLTELTTGVPGATYVKWSDALVALVPPGVVTVTSTVPAVPAGLVTLMLSTATLKLLIAAAFAPK
jgi:hypothetical protein